MPAIISNAEFEAGASSLKVRNPPAKARMVTGPVLLTGVAICASCDGGMTLRTGTSSIGKIHKYYTCSTCARQGKTAYKGRSIPMDKLDALITDNLIEKLFRPERLNIILGNLTERRSEKASEIDRRVSALKAEASTAEDN